MFTFLDGNFPSHSLAGICSLANVHEPERVVSEWRKRLEKMRFDVRILKFHVCHWHEGGPGRPEERWREKKNPKQQSTKWWWKTHRVSQTTGGVDECERSMTHFEAQQQQQLHPKPLFWRYIPNEWMCRAENFKLIFFSLLFPALSVCWGVGTNPPVVRWRWSFMASFFSSFAQLGVFLWFHINALLLALWVMFITLFRYK